MTFTIGKEKFKAKLGAGFAGNKAQYTDAQLNANGQHKLDTQPMLPSITCTKDQGAGDPKPCESRFPDACDRTKDPTGGGCCVPCGGLAPILPVTGLSLDVRPPTGFFAQAQPTDHHVHDLNIC